MIVGVTSPRTPLIRMCGNFLWFRGFILTGAFPIFDLATDGNNRGIAFTQRVSSTINHLGTLILDFYLPLPFRILPREHPSATHLGTRRLDPKVDSHKRRPTTLRSLVAAFGDCFHRTKLKRNLGSRAASGVKVPVSVGLDGRVWERQTSGSREGTGSGRVDTP